MDKTIKSVNKNYSLTEQIIKLLAGIAQHEGFNNHSCVIRNLIINRARELGIS